MKNKLLYIILLGFLYVGCDMGDFGNLNNDPNKPKDYDTRYLFSYSVSEVGSFFRGDWGARDQMYPHYFSEWRTVQQGEMQVLDYSLKTQYGRVIKNLDQIIAYNTDATTKDAENVKALGSAENQIAMCKILRAYFYLHYTDILGAIPYTEANKGKENYYPKYDSQESIYMDLYKQLKEAVVGLNTAGSINSSYDVFYEGDVAKWKKLGNSIRMIMALRLSKVNPTLGTTWFNETPHTAADFISDVADNFVHKFKKEHDGDVSENDNCNPIWENVILDGRDDYKPTKMLVDYMVTNSDPRLPAYFVKAINTNTYVGVPFGIKKTDIASYPTGTLSAFNDKFIAQDASISMISAAQMHFTLAEAIERGWVAGTASTEYDLGVKRSLEQHKVDTGYATYIAQAGIAYGNFDATVTDKYKQIAQQKWLSTFMQDGWEAWAEAKRAEWPVLTVGPAATITEMPRRLKYHSDDYSSNQAQYDAAVAMQGADDTTTRLWWDKL